MDEGRELDVLVGMRVFGERRDYGRGVVYVPKNFSRDIRDAWRVVEALTSRRWYVEVCCDPGEYSCVVWTDEGSPSHWRRIADGEGDTAPLAICRAALAAMDAQQQITPLTGSAVPNQEEIQ